MKVLCCLVGLAIGLLAAFACAKDLPETLLKNGDFSKKTSSWDGDGRVIKIDVTAAVPAGNAVLAIKLDRKEKQEFEQKFWVDLKRVKMLDLTFRVKRGAGFSTENPEDGTFAINFFRYRGEGGFVSRNWKLKDTDEWQTVKWPFGGMGGSRRMGLEIEVRPGTGILYFDDFVIVPREE